MENVERNTNVKRSEVPLEPPGAGTQVPMRIRYTLRFTGWPSLNQLVTVAVAAAAYTVLSWLSSLLQSGVPSVSFLFVAIGFGVPFAIWFGGWAFVIAYIGNFLGAGLLAPSPLPLSVALWFGTVDLIQLGLPVILYRLLAPRFGVSSIGKDVFTVRGFIFFLLCAVLPNNIIGGLYGNFILIKTVNPTGLLVPGWLLWSGSNIVVTIVIGSILLATLGPVVERFGLTVRNALN